MRSLTAASILALFVLGASLPCSGATPADDPHLASIEAKVEQLRRDYEARIAALEGEIAVLKKSLLKTSADRAAPVPDRTGGAENGPPGASRGQDAAPAPREAPTLPATDLERQLEKELGGSPGQTTAPQIPGQTSPQPQPWSPAQPITIAASGKNYLNLSFDTLMAGGSSSARDVGAIETGGHDPSQRGFTVQNVETVLEGAVDPYFRGQGNIVLQIDPEGHTSIELEEAYLTSTSLPHNLQLKAGMYFSEFGRLNSQHPHSWDFVDQPLVNGRFLGPDGLRNPGVRVSWLMPLPFYSELFVSVQNSQGETAASFRGEPGETVAGRTLQSRDLRTAGDLLYVPRWSGAFDLSDTQSLVVGASGAFGPNGSADDTSTRIYGVDLFWKWKATNAQAGFPFVKWQTEAMMRRYEAGAFESDTNGDGTADLFLPRETLRDRGAYSQIGWGFRRNWVVGLRGDWVAGDDAGLESDPTLQTRWRVSPNLTWFPTEFSKFRVQWNHDHLEERSSEDSLWLQFEFLLGAHAAHKF